jgi:hypothetical protein
VLLADERLCEVGEICSFDFGVISTSVTHSFQLLNIGGASGNIDRVSIVAGGAIPAFAIVDEPAETTLEHGGVASFAVEATPTSSDPSSATIRVGVADESDTIRLELSAALPSDALLSIEGGCEFGDVVTGTNSEPCLGRIANAGGVDAVVTDLIVDPASTFNLSGVVVLPLVVRTSSHEDVELIAHPVAAGVQTGVLTVVDDAGGVLVLPLSVNGI